LLWVNAQGTKPCSQSVGPLPFLLDNLPTGWQQTAWLFSEKSSGRANGAEKLAIDFAGNPL
jgi:hypothetical protein